MITIIVIADLYLRITVNILLVNLIKVVHWMAIAIAAIIIAFIIKARLFTILK